MNATLTYVALLAVAEQAPDVYARMSPFMAGEQAFYSTWVVYKKLEWSVFACIAPSCIVRLLRTRS
jgi:hypothetical protein